MSFAGTVTPVEGRSKTITRRLGWKNLRVGERVLAVDKSRTRNARSLAVIEIIDIRVEPLSAITDDDVAREGFPGKNALWFREFFIAELCRVKLPTADPEVRRIEYRYVDEP